MIIRLFCPKCAGEVSRKLVDHASIDGPIPIARLTDSGEYEVLCTKGHESTVVLDNLKFELLFEMGLNAIIDGYPREAVSSFAASLERFYEFYWRVVMTHNLIDEQAQVSAWKPLSNQSERQIGAYVTASLLLTKELPPLLKTNKEVPFRNGVIHHGYVPTTDEAISFGDSILSLITTVLQKLRELASEALSLTYAKLSPASKYRDGENSDDEGVRGFVNILTTLDVRYPPSEGDSRLGMVRDQINRILNEREPHGMEIMPEVEMKIRYRDMYAKGFAIK